MQPVFNSNNCVDLLYQSVERTKLRFHLQNHGTAPRVVMSDCRNDDKTNMKQV